MESLAMVAALVVLAIIVLGIVTAFVAWSNPKRAWSRSLGVLVSVPGIIAGVWLALLDVGIGARAIGGVVFALGTTALLRSALRG